MKRDVPSHPGPIPASTGPGWEQIFFHEMGWDQIYVGWDKTLVGWELPSRSHGQPRQNSSWNRRKAFHHIHYHRSSGWEIRVSKHLHNVLLVRRSEKIRNIIMFCKCIESISLFDWLLRHFDCVKRSFLTLNHKLIQEKIEIRLIIFLQSLMKDES